MTTLDALIQRLSSGALSDVQVTGFLVQDGGPPRCHLRLVDVYLQLGPGSWIRCSSVEHSWLRMALVDEIALDFGVPEGATRAVTSIPELCLAHPDSIRPIESLWMVADDLAAADTGVVDCACFDIQGGQCLFLDPMHLFGIRIGGPIERAAALAELAKHEAERFELLWRRGDDGVTTRRWHPGIPETESDCGGQS